MTHIDPDRASILRLQTPPLLCAARTTSIRAAQPAHVGVEIGKLFSLLRNLSLLLGKLTTLLGKLVPLLRKLLRELLVDLALVVEIGA